MFYVYILANHPTATMYVGMTDDLVARAWQHREHKRPGFTHRYNIEALVWYELHDSRDGAFTRERQIKKWRREWKDRLVRDFNPAWRDLFPSLL